MKGRLNSTLWMMVSVNAVAFLAVLWTAYHAGSMSNGVGIADAPSVSGSAGVYLVVALVLAVGCGGIDDFSAGQPCARSGKASLRIC